MTNENDLKNESELEIIGYEDWLNKKRIREMESNEILRLRLDLNKLRATVSMLEEKICQINNEFY